jgi:N-acetylmuramoyl-L-alanine amidase-like protein/zinc carboxypeptidase
VRTAAALVAALAIGGAGVVAAEPSGDAAATPAQPPIVQSPIPFGAKRKAEMRRYARRHYGIDRYTLVDPKVIVEHFTANNSYRATYRTFAADVPDVELHELPGVCAHFVIDRRGVIHQLVSAQIMCRHTVGLNWTAIGIEHVGTSDGAVMGNRRQLAASLRLTRWLQARFGIATRNVIGHSESLRSPYHHERVRRLQHQTHADFRHATMNRYRRRLGGGAATGSAVSPGRRSLLGRSVRGRRIEAVALGNPDAPRKVLVFGSIHGNEAAGIGITRRLRRAPPPQSAELWLVDELNPDGVANGTRQNARGVDLNRNFPHRWRALARRGDLTWSGPRPMSEPETRIARALIRRIHPAVTIWFHQPLGLVDRTGGDLPVRRRFARQAHLPLRGIPPYPGTATRWQNHRFPQGAAFVVELPGGRLARGLRDRCVQAVLSLTQ